MRFNYSEPNQQQKPDLHELLSLLQYTSPEAQQERQGQLQLLQAQTQHAMAESGVAQSQLQHLPDMYAQQAQELHDRLATSLSTRNHEDAATALANLQMSFLPEQHKAQIAQSAATTAAENMRTQVEQGIATNQPQAFADEHKKADAEIGAQNANAQDAIARGLHTMAILGHLPKQFSNDDTRSAAETALINAQTLKTQEADPMKLLGDINIAGQATHDSLTRAVLNLRDPSLGGVVTTHVQGETDATKQAAWDALRTKDTSLAKTPPTNWVIGTTPSVQSNNDPNASIANAIGQKIGAVPKLVLNASANVPALMDHLVINPIDNLLRGIPGYGPTPPGLNYVNVPTLAKNPKQPQQPASLNNVWNNLFN